MHIIKNIKLNIYDTKCICIYRKKLCACFHNRPGVMIYEPCRNFKIFLYFCTVPIKHKIYHNNMCVTLFMHLTCNLLILKFFF